MNKVFQHLDIVGYKPELMVHNRERYPSIFGKLIGSLTLLLVISISIYFIIGFIEGKEFVIIYNQKSALEPPVDLSSSPFVFGLNDANGQAVDPSLYEIRPFMWKYNNRTDNPGYEISEIPSDLCNSSHPIAGLRSKSSYNGFRCVPENNNISLYGKYGDSTNHSFVSLYFNFCNNKTTGGKCLPVSELEPKLKNVFVVLMYYNYEVLQEEYGSQFQQVLVTESLSLNWDLHSRYFYNFRYIEYTSDVGYLFEDKITKKIIFLF